MALSKLTYNSLNVTAAASKGIGFDSDPDALQADYVAGSMVFIKKLTASSDGTLDFVDGSSDVVLDDTYKEYIFTFKDIHPSNDSKNFQFQGSTDTGSSYGVTMTSTSFQAFHSEAGTDPLLAFRAGASVLHQETSFKSLTQESSADADHAVHGTLHLFNPSSTTFVKHWICRLSNTFNINYANEFYSAGYFNTTSAIDAIQFKFSANDIDAGDICLYGIN